MATTNTNSPPSQRRYPPELRERAVRMVREVVAEGGESFGVVTQVARQLGIGPESLRNWVQQGLHMIAALTELQCQPRPGLLPGLLIPTSDQDRGG